MSVDENLVWKIPRMWEGEKVFLLGGGPSLAKENLELLKDKHVIGVNNAYKLGEWIDICWYGDCRWWDWHKEHLMGWPGIVATCCQKRYQSARVKVCLRGKAVGIETKHSQIAWNKHSGGSAINLAYHLGAKRVVLLGYDMRRVDNKANWHDDHPAPQKNPYDRFLRSFPQIKRDADAVGMEIVNATPESALTLFPMTTLEEEA